MSVTAVRNHLAEGLFAALGPQVASVTPASMERRPGPEYAFNEPLLERALDQREHAYGPVIVAQLFLSPGRHAGEDGDVARICREAEARHPGLITCRTRVLGDHPQMLDLLEVRVRWLLNAAQPSPSSVASRPS